MTAPYDWVQLIDAIGKVLGTLVTVLSLLVVLARLRSLRLLLAYLGAAATILVPNSVLVYVWMYAATANSNRLGEAQVFVALTVQLSLFVSLYTFAWGKWIYPRLSPWLRRQATGAPPAPAPRESQRGE